MNKIPTCVASYSFHGLLGRGECDVFRYLDMLRFRYNVRHADIWTGFLPSFEDDFIDKVRGALERNELALANLCVDGPHVWMDDAEERAAHRRQMLDIIRAASKLGAKTIRVDFGGTNARAARVLRDLADEFAGKTILCVTHGGVLKAMFRAAAGVTFHGRFLRTDNTCIG